MITVALLSLPPAFARDPDAVVEIGDCRYGARNAGFVDLDADGVEDLVILFNENGMLVWPSTVAAPEGLWVPIDGVESTYHFEIAPATATQAARILVNPRRDEDVPSEYTLSFPGGKPRLELLWSDPEEWPWHYVGDVDGDGLSDMRVSDGIRHTSAGTLPLPSLDFDGAFNQPDQVSNVGDLDGDGYDDLFVAQRHLTFIVSDCRNEGGPGALYRGGPAGFDPVPLWVIDVPDRPNAGVGREVVAIPGEGTLVVTAVREEDEWDWKCSQDLPPAYLGVIRDAALPTAHLDELIEVQSSISMYGTMGTLWGLAEPTDPGEASSLIFGVSAEEPGFVQWYGVPTAADPLVASAERWDQAGPEKWLSLPRVAHLAGGKRGVLMGWSSRESDESDVLWIWGRTAESLGPAATVVTPVVSDGETCTVRTRSFTSPPWTTEGTEPVGDTADEPAEEAGAGGCGCGHTGAGGWLSLCVLAWVRRRA